MTRTDPDNCDVLNIMFNSSKNCQTKYKSYLMIIIYDTYLTTYISNKKIYNKFNFQFY